MSTTSLKLSDKLKQRAAAAAKAHGLSTHAFMVQAIELASTAAEERSRFVADALLSRKQALRTGKAFDADEVHSYLKARVAGKKATRPKAKPWRG